MTAVESVAASSKNISKGDDNILDEKNNENDAQVLQQHEVTKNSTENTKSVSTYLNSTQNNSLQHDTMSVQDIMYSVSNDVENMPDPTVVDSPVHKKIDTSVESTEGKKKKII